MKLDIVLYMNFGDNFIVYADFVTSDIIDVYEKKQNVTICCEIILASSYSFK